MPTTVNCVSDDGIIECLPLTQKYLSEVLILLNEIYFKEEHVSTLIGLDKSPEDLKELIATFVMELINHEISYVAVERATEKVVGCQINILAVKSNDAPTVYSCIKTNSPLAKEYVDINIQLDEAAKPFELLNTNCYVEPTIAVVHPKFRRFGILKLLCTASEQMIISLNKGENVKVALNGKLSSAPSRHCPTGAVVFSTATATSKTIEKLDYKKIYEFNFCQINKINHNDSRKSLNVEVYVKNF